MIVTVSVTCPECGAESTGTFHNPVHRLPDTLSQPCTRCQHHYWPYVTGRTPEEPDDDYGFTDDKGDQ